MKTCVHVQSLCGSACIGDWGRANLCRGLKGASLLHTPHADLLPTLYRNKLY